MSNKEEPELSFREISKWFHLSLKDAAEKCNTSQSTLKRRCRKLNIKQWPFRKVSKKVFFINSCQIQTLTHKVPGNLQNASQLVSLILQYLSQSPEAVNRFAGMTLHCLGFIQKKIKIFHIVQWNTFNNSYNKIMRRRLYQRQHLGHLLKQKLLKQTNNK